MMTSVAETTNLYSTNKTGRCVTTTKELEQVLGMYFRTGMVQCRETAFTGRMTHTTNL